MNVSTLTAQLKNKGFMVKEQEGGAYLLIHPSRGKYDWEADELRFRSVVLDAKTGNLVSSGWPKFFNQGEWADHDAAIAAQLTTGRAVITHKHDGSLLIRSVLPDGRILFRTRDTFDGGKFAPLAEAVARTRYPALLDPTVWPHGSLLFEYVGAGNQIVVRYEGDDDLILLGAAEHTEAGATYLPYRELARVAEAHALRLVETYDWASQTAEGVAAVLGLVQGWDKAEGVVVRSEDGQTLLKIKSAWYFAQHALRWHLTYEAICRFVIDGGITDEDALTAALMQAGWDFETTIAARGHFQTYQARRAEAEQVKAAAQSILAAFEAETAGQFAGDERARRKAFATRLFGPEATAEVRDLAKYCFLAYDNKTAQMEAALLRRLILTG
ncbi:MAG: hypothetical protein H7Z41_00995 [Cytophagales bacterium]|nr:hypothetical protein [Armatimonadota bacterium]